MMDSESRAFKRMHLRTSMKGSLNYSLRPLVTSKKDKNARRLFGNRVLVASSCNGYEESFEASFWPVTLGISNCDGTLKKTNKYTLARHIESRVASTKRIPLPSTCIIDGMSLVNKISGDNSYRSFWGHYRKHSCRNPVRK